ncbi:Uncharacterised protein [Bordetella pertussis]|nr:Uncharacterised protein [Bordetella pertussis]
MARASRLRAACASASAASRCETAACRRARFLPQKSSS